MNTTTFRPTAEVKKILTLRAESEKKSVSKIINEMILEAFNHPKLLPKELQELFNKEATEEDIREEEEFRDALRKSKKEQLEFQKKRDDRLEKLLND